MLCCILLAIGGLLTGSSAPGKEVGESESVITGGRVSECSTERSVGGSEVGSVTVSTLVDLIGGSCLALFRNSVRKAIRSSKSNWYASTFEISSSNVVSSSILSVIALLSSISWPCLAHLSWLSVVSAISFTASLTDTEFWHLQDRQKGWCQLS